MATRWRVNDFVRRKIRKLREAEGISAKDFAARLGLPRTSYASMEAGAYNIKLDHVFRALHILGAEITDVWPSETECQDLSKNPRHVLRNQEFRLNEIVTLAEADGAALFKLGRGSVTLLLSNHLSDSFLERLVLYLEDGRKYEEGLWFEYKSHSTEFFLYIRCGRIPSCLIPVVKYYMVIWAQFFTDFRGLHGPSGRQKPRSDD